MKQLGGKIWNQVWCEEEDAQTIQEFIEALQQAPEVYRAYFTS